MGASWRCLLEHRAGDDHHQHDRHLDDNDDRVDARLFLNAVNEESGDVPRDDHGWQAEDRRRAAVGERLERAGCGAERGGKLDAEVVQDADEIS